MDRLQPLLELLSGSSEPLVFHFPVHVLAPGLLAHPAASTSTLDQLEWRQVGGLILQRDKRARPEQRHHLGGSWTVVGHVLTGELERSSRQNWIRLLYPLFSSGSALLL